jgi:DNA-binding transcriptional MocR family regulator
MPIDPPERVPTPDWAPRLGIATRGQTHWPQESFGNPLLKADRTLVEQLVNWLSRRIDERVFPKGARLPSIRTMALTQGVSRSTVVAAYERMVALGYLDSRRGSGFYVRERAMPQRSARAPLPMAERPLDVGWLLRNMFRALPADRMPGGGLPPPDWLDGDLIAAQVRAVGRQRGESFLDYGHPQGFIPLRNQLSFKLAEQEIGAEPNQILLTTGATQALDLVARHLVEPGDTVLVDDPAWFLMFGMFSTHGARVIGVPRLADGPDLSALEMLIEAHRPKFYVVHSVLHNPTSTSLSAAKAYRILSLAETHDFMLIEDDVYGDLHPGAASGRGFGAVRLASLDQLRRVIYIGSFSKTLGANLRVGYLAGALERVGLLADLKLLTTLTTPELGERVVYRILSEGYYRKHLDRLRLRLDAIREATVRNLESVGFDIEVVPAAGMFLWARAMGPNGPIDTNRVAARMMEEGFVLAPGSLFSPDQLPSPWMRFNVATSQHPGMLDALRRVLAEESGRKQP